MAGHNITPEMLQGMIGRINPGGADIRNDEAPAKGKGKGKGKVWWGDTAGRRAGDRAAQEIAAARIEAHLQQARVRVGGDAGPAATGAGAAAAAEPPLNITCRFMDGAEKSFSVMAHHRIHVLKTALCADLGVTMARVRLITDTQVLRGDHTVREAHLEDGSVVSVVVLPPLYQGSEVYEKIAAAFGNSQAERISDQEVHDNMEKVMERKVLLHDALAAMGKLLPVV